MGYNDSDGDGFTIGNGQQVCSGASLPSGYSSTKSQVDDCDDHNSNIFSDSSGRCGVYISTCSNLNLPGYIYRLKNSITNFAPSGCITISSNNIELDCQGYRIRSSSTGKKGIVLNSNSNNLVIRNCDISLGTGSNNYAVYISYGTNITIKDSSFNSNLYGLYFTPSDYLQDIYIINVTSNYNSQAGIIFNSNSLYIKNIYIADSKFLSNNPYGLNFVSSITNGIRNITLVNNNLNSNSQYSIAFSILSGGSMSSINLTGNTLCSSMGSLSCSSFGETISGISNKNKTNSACTFAPGFSSSSC